MCNCYNIGREGRIVYRVYVNFRCQFGKCIDGYGNCIVFLNFYIIFIKFVMVQM